MLLDCLFLIRKGFETAIIKHETAIISQLTMVARDDVISLCPRLLCIIFFLLRQWSVSAIMVDRGKV